MELITPLYNAVVALGAVEFSWVGQLSHNHAPDSSDFTCEYSTKSGSSDRLVRARPRSGPLPVSENFTLPSHVSDSIYEPIAS